MRLKPISDSIWTIAAPLSLGGLKLNTRTTLIRLDDGSLWVHSPVQLTEALKSEVEALGPVRWLVSPCLLHHLYIGSWKSEFPEATILAPKGLSKKRPDLDISNTIREGASWNDEVEVVYLEGFPANREHVFFHKAELILTDLCFFNPNATGLTGLYLWINGVTKRPNLPLLVKFMIKDKKPGSIFGSNSRLANQHISFCHHSIVSEGAQSNGIAFWMGFLWPSRETSLFDILINRCDMIFLCVPNGSN